MEDSGSSAIPSPLWLALQALTSDEAYYREDLLEALDGRLRELRNQWQIDTRWINEASKANCLKQARNLVSTHLKLHITKLKAPTGVSPDKYMHAVLVSFNLPHSLIKVDLSKKDLTRRHEWLEREAPIALRVSPRTSRRYIRDAITQIEQQMLRVDGDEVEPSARSSNSLYVVRDSLHAEFAQLIDDGAKLIVIHGYAGMGKTWLATELTRGAPVIPVLNGAIDRASLQAALIASHSDLGILPHDSEDRLAALLCGKQAPPYVVIDGLESADDLAGLIPQATRSTVLATCRARGELPPQHAAFIKVSRMSSPQAASMVRTQLPDLNDSDISKLTRTLGYYPLALKYACGLMGEYNVSAEEYCEGITSDIAHTTRGIFTSDRSTLYAVTARMVAQIHSRDPLASKLLSVLALFGSQPLRQTTLADWADAWSQHYCHPKVTSTRFAQAISLLVRCGMIDSCATVSFMRCRFLPAAYEMHALASHLLVDELIEDQIEQVAIGLARYVDNMRVLDRQNESEMDRFTRHFVTALKADRSLIGAEEMKCLVEGRPSKLGEALEREFSSVMTNPLEFPTIRDQLIRLCGRLIIDRTSCTDTVADSFTANPLLVRFLVKELARVKSLRTKAFRAGLSDWIPERWFSWAEDIGPQLAPDP